MDLMPLWAWWISCNLAIALLWISNFSRGFLVGPKYFVVGTRRSKIICRGWVQERTIRNNWISRKKAIGCNLKTKRESVKSNKRDSKAKYIVYLIEKINKMCEIYPRFSDKRDINPLETIVRNDSIDYKNFCKVLQNLI